MRVKLDPGAFAPERAHAADAGLDIRTPVKFSVQAFESAIVHTGIHVEIPSGYVGFFKSKSGLNVNHGIVSEGVIDAGYTGGIVVKLYNHNSAPMHFAVGDKITQLVVLPIAADEIEIVEELDETERGANGFGSTGR